MLSKVFKLKWNLFQNNLKILFHKYPVILLISVLLFAIMIGAVLYGINYFIVNINLAVNDEIIMQKNINRAVSRAYNIVLGGIATLIILKKYTIKKRNIPEILLINRYGVLETVHSFSLAESFLNIAFIIVCTLPIFWKVISLYEISILFQVGIILTLYIYLLSLAYLVQMLLSIMKYILIYKLKLLSAFMIEELVLIISLGIMAGVCYLCFCTNLIMFTPSYQIIDCIATFIEKKLIFAYLKLCIHILLGIVILILCKYITSSFERDYSYDICKKAKSRLKFNNKIFDNYFILVLKTFHNNSEKMLGIVSILTGSVIAAKILGNTDDIYSYIELLFYMMILFIVLGVSTFICEFEDYDVYEVLKNYKGNAVKYNFILYIVEVIFSIVTFSLYLYLFYYALGMRPDSIWEGPIAAIPLLCSLAVFVRKILLGKDASVSMKTCATMAVVCIYFASQAFMSYFLGNLVSESLAEGIYKGWLLSGMVFFYIWQLILVKREWGEKC
ncbi:hypothetical protein [Lachnotalea glycerini]|uniref:Uncharacterized protein n=1 Tax=Lachnotalea glycerini TaxID=1763509 RepID=A0A371JH15_9FIRM|nr:hypothetical protein [Lachnotalea glycerini]RDY31996.1 hypothetical protein CG710_006755 [Lachnotalea glycerini]